jgi:hypothetical protein
MVVLLELYLVNIDELAQLTLKLHEIKKNTKLVRPCSWRSF